LPATRARRLRRALSIILMVLRFLPWGVWLLGLLRKPWRLRLINELLRILFFTKQAPYR
jgi:hypothetical protein